MTFPNSSAINYTHDHIMVPVEPLRIEMIFYDNKSPLLAEAVASQAQCPHSFAQLKLLRFPGNDGFAFFPPKQYAGNVLILEGMGREKPHPP
jgi:hypothetical protein